MSTQTRYTMNEKIFLFLLFVASIGSLFFFYQYKTLAFPEYNIDFQINKDQSAEKAEGFLSSRNIETTSYNQTTIFQEEHLDKTYLERELGVEQTTDLARQDFDLWHFTTRFFQPSEQKEYTVSYTVMGKLVEFHTVIPEGETSASLSKEEARLKGEQFLAIQPAINISDWQLIGEEEKQRPQRKDYFFTWEKQNFQAKEATYRIEVGIFGDQIGSYQEFFKVPESWQRQYAQETSQNQLAQMVFETISLVLFGLGIIIIFIVKFRSNTIRLRFATWVGGATTLVVLLATLNNFPLAIFSYDTTESWNSFIATYLFSTISVSLFQGVIITLIVASGEAMYRSLYPHNLAIEYLFTKAVTSKSFHHNLLIGTFVGCLMFSYVVLYYIVGQRVGVWVPADVNYSDLFNTYIPWIYPLLIGFLAAVTEEGIFRLFGIPFLQKYLKSTWIAIIITAVVWAFLHSNYPQSPWYARGLEITPVGILFGFLFVRFGIVASVVAHYIFNALQTAIFFYTSQDPYVIASSTLVSFIPVIGALLLFIPYLKRGFAPQDNLQNERLSAPTFIVKQIKDRSNTILSYMPLHLYTRIGLLVIGLLGAIISVMVYSEIRIIDKPLSITRQDIHPIAKQYLSTKGINTDFLMGSLRFTLNQQETVSYEYILENSSFQKLKEIYPAQIPLTYWNVRYFKPLQKEEFYLDIYPDGSIYSYQHIVDENASGAKLDQETALTIAKTHLKKDKQLDITSLNLLENNSRNRAQRVDHSLVFENNTYKVADGTVRISMNVLGDEPNGFASYFQVPEQWIREKVATNLQDFIPLGVGTTGIGLLIVLTVITFLRLVRSHKIHFKRVFVISGLITTVFIIAEINNLPAVNMGYNTAIPYTSFIAQTVLLKVLIAVLLFFVVTFLIGMFTALWIERFGSFIPIKGKKSYFTDALILAYTISPIMLGISSLITYLLISQNWLRTPQFSILDLHLDSFIPALGVTLQLVMNTLGLMGLGIILLILFSYLYSWKKVALVLLSLSIIMSIPWQHSVQAFILSLLENTLLIAGVLILIFLFLRNNIIAYIGTTYTSLFVFSGISLLSTEHTFYHIQGLVLIIVSLLPLLLYLWFTRTNGLD